MLNRTREFLKSETSGGLVLFLAAVAAILVANSPLRETYLTSLSVRLGPLSLQGWINDGLMAIFFFVVGMEIKFELTSGSLASRDRALLPGIGAAGGMIVPALVFLMIAPPGIASRGFGIPMATDIAFALGVVVLLGRRVPLSLKIFLLALAIVDDLGAVLVIAVFYTAKLNWEMILLATGALFTVHRLARRNLSSPIWMVPLGVLAWWFVHESGVHATIAGCILGFLVPYTEKWVRRLHSLSTFAIMPLFAFANAGLAFDSVTPAQVFSDPLVNAVAFGLLVGKPVGIFGACWLAIRWKVARLNEGMTWMSLLGVACVGGVGFTMSLFVASLAWPDPQLLALAKIGIVKGSMLSAMLGVLVLCMPTIMTNRRKK